MTDGLKDKHRAAIIAEIAANDRVERAVLFGSRATGTNTATSDVDIALFGDRLTLTDHAYLAAALDGIPMAQSVDLLLYDSIESQTLREHIRRQGIEWYARTTRDEECDTALGSPSLLDCLPPGWERSTLGAACERGGGNIQTGPFGSQLHASDYRPVGIPSIMPQNLGDNRVIEDGIARVGERDASRLTRYLVRAGDIVYSRRGDVERRALIGPREDGWLCGTGCLRVRLGENGVDPQYASYYLGHPVVREWIVRHAHGATMPNLNTAILSACPFVIPPISEQRSIAHILGTLDDKIELNRRMNQTLEAMARALFKSWFVDFDPVRAKMEGRDTGLPMDITDLFPDRLVESELGETPEGWEVSELGDMIELAYGKALKAKARHPAGRVPVFGSNGQIGWHNEALVEGPGIVVGRKGNPGTVTLSPTEFFPIDTTLYVVPKNGHDDCLYFLFFALRNQDLPSVAADSAVPGLNRNMAYMNEQIMPPMTVVEAFDGHVSTVYARCHRVAEESRTLAALRDALLPKLVSGDLRVGNWRA